MFARQLVLCALWASLLLGAAPANAGFFVCNDTGVKISVSVGWAEGDVWNSKGWFNIEPRDCALAVEGVLSNRIVYYYAEYESLVWSGGDRSAFFCADHQNRYHYALREDPPDCEGYDFKRIDTGGEQQYTIRLSEGTVDPQTAAANCADRLSDRDDFVKCWTREVATYKQRKILDCIQNTDTNASMAVCAAANSLDGDAAPIADCTAKLADDHSPAAFGRCALKGQFNAQQAALVDCAIDNEGRWSALADCAVGSVATPQEREIYRCIADNLNDYKAGGLCLIESRIPKDQRRIVGCVLQNQQSYVAMGICAAGVSMTPEQQVFVQCASTTGGEPMSFAGCVGTALTVNELQKCLDEGIGGSGCFGDNNTAVRLVQNAWKDVTDGPGPSNDLLGRDGFVIKSLENIGSDIESGPRSSNDLVGKDGFVCQTFLGGC